MEKVNGAKKLKHKIVIVMKVNISSIKNLVLVFSHGKVVINIEGPTKMMKDMDMVKCTGLMVATTKENGFMEFSMV
jgi:hypothetical protein